MENMNIEKLLVEAYVEGCKFIAETYKETIEGYGERTFESFQVVKAMENVKDTIEASDTQSLITLKDNATDVIQLEQDAELGRMIRWARDTGHRFISNGPNSFTLIDEHDMHQLELAYEARKEVKL